MSAQHKKKGYSLIVFTGLILTTTAVLVWYLSRPGFIHYKDFGIDMPVNYTVHGIDVSHYQHAIDWTDVKNMRVKNIKISFCFIKATEGSDDTDNRFKKNWRGAKAAGLTRGAYHFFNPERDGKSQADNFMSTVTLQQGDLPPVLDIETPCTTGKLILQQRIKNWLTAVEQRYKVKPIIYTGADFYAQFLAGKFDDYPLWVAHYWVQNKPRVQRNWQFWQHNESGHVNGIGPNVDFNVFNGDSSDFKQLLLK